MNWNIVLTQSLAIGLGLSIILTILVIASMLINKEMWLDDYPSDVRAKWGPISPLARRQHTVMAVISFGVLIGAIVYAIIRLGQALGSPPSPLEVFSSVVIVFVFFNIYDAVIIDWLILLVLWPGLAVLPGTEDMMASYRNLRYWTVNLLKGFILAPFAGLLAAVVVYVIRWIAG